MSTFLTHTYIAVVAVVVYAIPCQGNLSVRAKIRHCGTGETALCPAGDLRQSGFPFIRGISLFHSQTHLPAYCGRSCHGGLSYCRVIGEGIGATVQIQYVEKSDVSVSHPTDLTLYLRVFEVQVAILASTSPAIKGEMYGVWGLGRGYLPPYLTARTRD